MIGSQRESIEDIIMNRRFIKPPFTRNLTDAVREIGFFSINPGYFLPESPLSFW